MSRSRKRLSAYQLRRARQAFDEGRIDKRTRVGQMALQAMRTRGRKSEEQQAALAAVGYPGYQSLDAGKFRRRPWALAEFLRAPDRGR